MVGPGRGRTLTEIVATTSLSGLLPVGIGWNGLCIYVFAGELRKAMPYRSIYIGLPRVRLPGPAGAGRTLSNQGGWTLAEIMVVTGLILALAGIAVPQYSQLSGQMRAQSAAAQVLGDVGWARLRSLATANPHYINFTGEPVSGYTIQRVATVGAVPDPDNDAVLRSIDLANKMPGVVVALNSTGVDPYGGDATVPISGPFVFNSQGLPVSSPNWTFYVDSGDGSAAFAVSFTAAGNGRIWRLRDGVWR